MKRELELDTSQLQFFPGGHKICRKRYFNVQPSRIGADFRRVV